MSAEEPELGGSTQPTLDASCAIDPNDPSRYLISYTGSGFQPGRQIDIMVRGEDDDPSESSDPLGPGGVTGSFSRTMPYSGRKGRKVIVFADRHIPPVEVEVRCPDLEEDLEGRDVGRGCLGIFVQGLAGLASVYVLRWYSQTKE